MRTPARSLLLRLLLLTVAVAAAAAPARAGAPAAAVAPPPKNVVLVLTDDQTMEAVQRMPYVSSQSWVSFTRARVENGLCCPSRATLLQGRYDVHTGVTNNAQAGLFDPTEALPVWLQRAGYQTGIFGKYLNSYDGVGVPPGWNDSLSATR